MIRDEWQEARRHAMAHLHPITMSLSTSPRHHTVWTGVGHPLVLAVLEYRTPDLAWFGDPFAEPEISGSIPTVFWRGGMLHASMLGMPRAHVDKAPQAGQGPDGGCWEDVGYFIDTSEDDPVSVVIAGRMPRAVSSALEGGPLCRAIELPPFADPGLREICRGLTISRVMRGRNETRIDLAPTRWLPCAPRPDPLPEGVDLSFLDMPVIL